MVRSQRPGGWDNRWELLILVNTMRCLELNLVAIVIALSFLVGCGPRTVTVTGTVLRDKQPVPLSSTGVLQVTLVPDVATDAGFTTHVGRCDNTGKFEVLDVPPGKYKVAIEQLDPNPQVDMLGGAFSQDRKSVV